MPAVMALSPAVDTVDFAPSTAPVTYVRSRRHVLLCVSRFAHRLLRVLLRVLVRLRRRLLLLVRGDLGPALDAREALGADGRVHLRRVQRGVDVAARARVLAAELARLLGRRLVRLEVGDARRVGDLGARRAQVRDGLGHVGRHGGGAEYRALFGLAAPRGLPHECQGGFCSTSLLRSSLTSAQEINPPLELGIPPRLAAVG